VTKADFPFALFGDLPTGQVAIEASAGTGKTFTLAALAARYLAERGVAPSELLIVTFTRAATAELRSRIRGQMVASAVALAGDSADFGKDKLSTHLASHDRETHRRRLERAVSDFDTVAISTMHSFAAQIRGTLGISSAIDPDARLTTDVATLVRHACADALASSSGGDIDVDELPTLSELVKATERYVGEPDMDLEPTPRRAGATAEQIRLRELVIASRANLMSRRQDSGTMGYDDVLSQLRGALVDRSSAAVIEALRSRFSVVLIDEFQDTDRVQWEIFSTLFGKGAPNSTLVLVGDPKQAIYRFRGADISVYLRAVGEESGSERFSLSRNWRSDGAAIRAMNTFFDGATFGDDAIAYVPVEASDEHEPLRMTGTGGQSLSGLDIRIAVGSWLPRARNLPSTPKTARIINRDLVAHVRGLLDGASIPDGEGGTRRLRPSDIAVLVKSGAHARSAQNALRRQGVPAVVAGAGSVLESWAADQFRLLLSAMERPSDLGRIRAYALSWFESWTASRVAHASDEDLAVLQERLSDWTARLASRPVAEVLAAVWDETGVVARLLGEFDGDRNVTDLDHLAELLHDSATQGMSGIAGLLALLDHPPQSEGDIDVDGDVTARRIESEAQAVQIMTIWKAKGLQFPVVCLPMLWRQGMHPSDVIYTDPTTRHRTMDLAKGKDWPDAKAADERKQLARREEASDELRLLYVALTRAQHHTAVWWANSSGSSTRALSRFLFSRDHQVGSIESTVFRSGGCAIPAEDEVPGVLDAMARRSDRTITVTSIADPPAPATPWVDTVVDPDREKLEISQLTVDLDRSVHRWSFSAITSGADAGPDNGLDPYDPTGADRGADDEDESGGPEIDSNIADAAAAGGPLARLRAGTQFGTFVHAVLERVDFAAADLDGAIADAVHMEFTRSGTDLSVLAPEGTNGTDLLNAGLRAAIETPLGPLFGSTRLADLGRRDRLDELAFDMRIGEAGRHPTIRDIGSLVAAYLPGGHPLTPWATALTDGAVDVRLAGYLTGSIDLVARLRADGGVPRFVVADYKTNQLTPWGAEPGPDDYDVRHMADAMSEHHYPLQALLYAVALQRYLRSRRRPGVPTAQVVGATYLFVRGMTGAEVTHDNVDPHGVFTWVLDPELIASVSDLLDGQGTGGTGGAR
jgi:exodeoxyribonuclease V beta subunit